MDRFSPWAAPWDDVQEASEAVAIAIAMFGEEIDPEHGGLLTSRVRKSCELKLRLNIAADILRLGAQ